MGADRRRVRGAHRGLKQILVEGMTNGGGEHPRPWKDFSGAMVRQAVNEALNQLPPDHKQVVKLAYFGGLSNREIAQNLGLSIGGVQRRLRQALARVSEHVEHGRRAFIALLSLLAAGRLVHAVQVAAVAAAVSIIALQPAPAQPSRHSVAPGNPPAAVQQPSVPAARPATTGSAAADGSAQAVKVMTALPAPPVKLPALPSLPPLPSPPALP